MCGGFATANVYELTSGKKTTLYETVDPVSVYLK